MKSSEHSAERPEVGRIPIEIHHSDDRTAVHTNVMALASALRGMVQFMVPHTESNDPPGTDDILAYQITAPNISSKGLLDLWQLLIQASPEDRARLLQLARNLVSRTLAEPRQTIVPTPDELKAFGPALEKLTRLGFGPAAVLALLLALINLLSTKQQTVTIFNISSYPQASAEKTIERPRRRTRKKKKPLKKAHTAKTKRT